MKKYELTNESIVFNDVKLYRIKAIKSFSNVRAGELGGFIEKEENLSQFGDSWVYGEAKVFGNAKIQNNAKVFDNARVFDNAIVSGNAHVYGNAIVCGDAHVFGIAQIYDKAVIYGSSKVFGKVLILGLARICGDAEIYKFTHLFQLGSIGSRNDFTTFFRTKDNEIYVTCGCFYGSIDKFEQAVRCKHKGTKHEETYLLAIELAKKQIELN